MTYSLLFNILCKMTSLEDTTTTWRRIGWNNGWMGRKIHTSFTWVGHKIKVNIPIMLCYMHYLLLSISYCCRVVKTTSWSLWNRWECGMQMMNASEKSRRKYCRVRMQKGCSKSVAQRNHSLNAFTVTNQVWYHAETHRRKTRGKHHFGNDKSAITYRVKIERAK